MNKYPYSIPVLLGLTLFVSVAAVPMGGNEIELEEAEVFIEFNSTDGDFGIQFFWDGEPWKAMRIDGPGEVPALKVKVTSTNLERQGMSEGFFESNEPSLDKLSMMQFFQRFPEGTYEFEGRTREGDELEGETELTHTLPAPPVNLFPAAGDEVDANNPLVASFDAVSSDLQGNPLAPELYEIVVETEGDLLKVFSVILDGDTAHPSVTVPPEFLEPGTEYKLEVIVQEESGNRTISETEFSTR